MSNIRTLASLAWREGRAARRRLLLYMSSIALGVAALVSIDSFANNVTASVREQSRTLMGGDAQLNSRQAFPPTVDSLLDSLAREGIPHARATTFPSMVSIPRTGKTRLAQIRGVDSAYPFYGEITTEPRALYPQLQSGPYALVDSAILSATDATIGDTLTLGYAKFIILGILKDVPGTSGIAAALGPRVYVSQRYLETTQLLSYGSTAEYSALLKLPNTVDSKTFAETFRPRLDTLRVQLRTVSQSQRNTENATETLGTFIGIVGLVALLLGGIGVASGVRAFVARKIDTVAILRCLGASSRQILAIYVTQAAAMGLIGATIGAMIGVAIQFLLPQIAAPLLPVDVSPRVDLRAISAGILVGGWVALIFSLQPLLALRGISPLQTLRRDTDAQILSTPWNDTPRLLVYLALIASVVIVALLRAPSIRHGVWVSAATGAVILILIASAWILSASAKRVLRQGWPYVIRQGVANVYRPSNQTRSVVLALGFGAFLLTTLYLVQASLLKNLSLDASASGANLVFFDVQDDQAAPLDSLIRSEGYPIIQIAPIVTMRIAEINGQDVRKLSTDTLGERPARWALRREYRSTFRDSLLGGETLVSGRWFQHDETGSTNDTAEVSLERGIAEELHVQLNDVITWDVQGILIPARVTSLREVKWTRFEPNFFAVFSPGWLEDAPKQYVVLTNVALPSAMSALQHRVIQHFPNVSSIDLSLITRTIGAILEKVDTAIRALAIFGLAMGIPVLFSAIAATHRDRIREGVLLKTLGASRAQIRSILMTEYALLGLLGSGTGLLLALGAGWALTNYMFNTPFAPTLWPALGIMLLMMSLTVLIGLWASRDVFRETAVAALRE
jgi:putative ABC transport system permease protein